MPRHIVTGSIAYDYLMTFPGTFTELLLPEHLKRLSLSFLVDEMEKRRGGCAPNIAYTLALLGERPVLMGTAGQDFSDYRAWLDAANIDTSLVREVPDKFTASFFCSTDTQNNQIASFYTGAMANADELSFRTAGAADLAIVSPNDPKAMVQYAEECRAIGLRYIFDPGQQCARMEGPDLAAGLVGANVVICNDYEYELIREKTRLDVEALLEKSEAVIVTKGEKGSSIHLKGRQIDVPVAPERNVADPTGVGDAYRGGLMKGLAIGADWEVCGRIGSVAATYVLEHVGGQSHAFTLDEFRERYVEAFGGTQPF
ncbi:MAG TPA: carbohydrate kinase family protein [Luteitalea sp.]|nr:carbohydrate kinase family protein [Luteitalea sp.]